MSRFGDFYDCSMIVEKVSKKDINDALADTDILVGAEFEFIMDSYGSVASKDYDQAYTDWKKFTADVVNAVSQYDDLQKEVYELYTKVDKLESKLEDIQDDLDEAAADLGSADEKLKAVKEKPEEYYTKFKTTKKKAVAAAEKEVKIYTKHQEFIESKLNVMEDNVKDAKDDLEARQDNYLDEIDWPSMGQAYIDYMDEYSYGSSELEDIFTIVAENGTMPPEPEEFGATTDSIEAIEDHMDQTGMLKDAPFKKYQFGEYGSVSQSVGSDLWAIENDGSLDDGGVEIKSPPMPITDFMKMLPKMLKWIGKHGHTDSDTGMHVHMSIKGVNDLNKEINRLKMILFMDEGFIWNAFADRMNSTFVRSVKDKLKSQGELSMKDASNVFDDRKIALKLATIHDDAINFQNKGKGHIEYRYLGGMGYEKKLSSLTTAIGHFAHNMAIGYNPNFKKKEYARKLRRIFNKMDLFSFTYKIDTVERRLATLDKSSKKFSDAETLSPADRKNLMKLITTWKKSQVPLKKVYKISTKDMAILNRNGGYTQSIWDKYKIEMKKYLTIKGLRLMQAN